MKNNKSRSPGSDCAFWFFIGIISFVAHLSYQRIIVSEKDKHFVGNINHVGYTQHGDVTGISNWSCEQGSLISTSRDLIYYNDEFYSSSIDKSILRSDIHFFADAPVNLNVKTLISDYDQLEATTVINSKKAIPSNLRVPFTIECEPLLVEIASIGFKDQAVSVPITDICPGGKVVLPSDKVVRDGYSTLKYSVSESANGKSWLINSVLDRRDAFNSPITSSKHKEPLDKIVPVEMACQYSPKQSFKIRF